MTGYKSFIGILIFLVFFGCAQPEESEVKKSYERENPNIKVTSVYLSEGDSVAMYFTIHFEDINSGTKGRACWQYMKSDQGWYVNHKSKTFDMVSDEYCR